jgi:hypothetical protein
MSGRDLWSDVTVCSHGELVTGCSLPACFFVAMHNDTVYPLVRLIYFGCHDKTATQSQLLLYTALSTHAFVLSQHDSPFNLTHLAQCTAANILCGHRVLSRIKV